MCITVIWSTTNGWLLHYCHPGSSKRWEENETGTGMNTVVVLKGEKPAQTLRSDRSAVLLLKRSCEADVFTASTVCSKARVLVSRSAKLLLSTMARGFLFVRCCNTEVDINICSMFICACKNKNSMSVSNEADVSWQDDWFYVAFCLLSYGLYMMM